MTQIRKLTKDEMYNIYHTHLIKDFPAGEVKPWKSIVAGMERKQYFAYGMYEQDELQVYGFAIYSKAYQTVLLDYLAVVEGKRSKGYGSAFLTQFQELLAKEQIQLILEVENPDYAPDEKHKEYMNTRIRFYERNRMHVSNVSCNFYDNEYRILYAGELMQDTVLQQKVYAVYCDFFGETFIREHARFHAI